MKRRIFDSHLHIIDPAFPLVPNKGYLPGPFRIGDSLREAHPLGVTAGMKAVRFNLKPGVIMKRST